MFAAAVGYAMVFAYLLSINVGGTIFTETRLWCERFDKTRHCICWKYLGWDNNILQFETYCMTALVCDIGAFWGSRGAINSNLCNDLDKNAGQCK